MTDKENLVYIHTKGYFSANKDMKSCCLHNGEETGRYSVKWGKPSMEQQILYDFTHRPKLKGISQTLSGTRALVAEDSVERSRERWKRLDNILPAGWQQITIYSTFLNVRIKFECFYHKEMMNMRIYMLILIWILFNVHFYQNFIWYLYGTCNLYKLCQLKIKIKKLLGPNQKVHFYLSINETKLEIHNYSFKN